MNGQHRLPARFFLLYRQSAILVNKVPKHYPKKITRLLEIVTSFIDIVPEFTAVHFPEITAFLFPVYR